MDASWDLAHHNPFEQDGGGGEAGAVHQEAGDEGDEEAEQTRPGARAHEHPIAV